MRPLVAAAFAYLSFMWGSTYLFIKIGLGYLPPFLLSGLRNLIASGALMLVMFALRQPWPRSWREWWPPLAFGLINGTSFALIGWGEQFIPSGQTAVIVASMPLFTLFIAWLWIGERITWGKSAAVILGLTGVLMATGNREGAGFMGTGAQRMAGQAAMVGAALCYATSYVFGKKYFRAGVMANTTVHLATAGTYVLILSLLFDPPARAGAFALPAVGSLLYLALPGSALAYLCMFYMMEHMSAVGSTYVTLINPIVATLLGVAVMGERITLPAVAGTGLVLAGVWLVNRKH